MTDSMHLFQGSYVRVEDDEMTAWLYLAVPESEEFTYTKEIIMELLRAKGVTAGYHTSNISAMVKKRIYNREVIVARGKQGIEGIDGYYDYKFSPETHKAPAIRPDGSVDYSSMSMLQNVRKGDVLAIYHHAVEGEDGYTVKGKIVKVKPPKELRSIRGKNITNEENPDIYVSEIDGKVELKNGRVDVQNVHEIIGDVNLITGKVEFYGDVVINGNVEAGVTIRSGRNIIIRGIVEAVTMSAGGDIILERGIQGGLKAKLSARGSIFADFIEHSNVEVGGDVNANIILNSQISAEGQIILTGKKGQILGGTIHGLQGVKATTIGNSTEIHTMVHAGYTKEDYENMVELNRKEQNLNGKLTEVVQEMTELIEKGKRTGSLKSTVLQYKLEELNKRRNDYSAKLDAIGMDKKILQEVINKGRGAKITVDGPIFRGVTVAVEGSQMPVEHNTRYMQYSCYNGIIEGKVIIV